MLRILVLLAILAVAVSGLILPGVPIEFAADDDVISAVSGKLKLKEKVWFGNAIK